MTAFVSEVPASVRLTGVALTIDFLIQDARGHPVLKG